LAVVSPLDSVASLSTPRSIPTRLEAFRRTPCTSATSIWSAMSQLRTFLGEGAGADRCKVRQRVAQIKFEPPGHAFEDERSIGQPDPGKFAEAEPAIDASI
jgi:hypothetical protein